MNEKQEFKPYIPADKVMPELTVTSCLLYTSDAADEL